MTLRTRIEALEKQRPTPPCPTCSTPRVIVNWEEGPPSPEPTVCPDCGRSVETVAIPWPEDADD